MSRKPGDKCLGHILCPQCKEEKGDSKVFRSRYTFSTHLIRHAIMVEETIPQNDYPGNTHYSPEHKVWCKSTPSLWWPKWAEKYMRLNKLSRMSVSGKAYAIINGIFYDCDHNDEGCVTCELDFTKCGFHDTTVPFNSCWHWEHWGVRK